MHAIRTVRALSALLGKVAALGATAALLTGLAGTAQAEPVWQESAVLSSTLTGDPVYVVNGTTATVTYNGQSATNNGSTAEQFGMYFAWMWIFDGDGQDTQLLWDNATQRFVGQNVSLAVQRPGHADQYLRIGDIVNESWAGVPWSPGYGTPIASDADWVVPFFDFGVIGAGEEVNFDLEFVFTFSDEAALSNFVNFYAGAQGVQAPVATAIPEPDMLTLAGVALLAAMLGGRVRRRR